MAIIGIRQLSTQVPTCKPLSLSFCLSIPCAYVERLVGGSLQGFVADHQLLTFRSALICVGKAYLRCVLED